jgi:DNA-binding winged helix-turn-helix (wHTH) protein/Tfp pilus assembly protein PilF
MMGSRSFADDLPGAVRPDEIARASGATAADLAHRPDFTLGAATISPSRRAVEGPGGKAAAEPRVMQVLVALVDAGGAVLSRDDLIHRCWGGTIVGDDSINRAIAEIRRLERATLGGFTVETVPRVGYRLIATGDIAPGSLTRRRLMAGALAAASTAAAGVWLAVPPRPDPRVAGLIERGEQALRYALPDSTQQGVTFLRQAVAIEPENAEAWGLLALALRNVAENAEAAETTPAVLAAEQAARRALALDPREGNALAALAKLRPSFGDWLDAESRLLDVLRVAPDNVAAISGLVVLLQQVGRRRDSWNWNERAIALDPLSPIHQYRKALKLWIFGRVPEADQTIDRALQLWPRHPAVWNARLLIFAFTGRARAGAAMIDDEAARPATLTPPAIALWRTSLRALDTRSGADVAAARAANLDAAPRSPGFAVNAAMVLSMLGKLDDAFAVAEGYLLRRGPLIGTQWTGSGQMPVNDQRWRRNMFLWTPATAAMRADPRFVALCDGIGLTEYWRRRGIRPD